MSAAATDDVRRVVLAHVAAGLRAKGLSGDELPDDFDLLLEGVIDSFGLLELIMAVERRFGLQLGFDDLDADDMTRLGPFCSYVAAEAAKAA